MHAAVLGFVFLTPWLGSRGMVAMAALATVLNAFVLPRTAFGRSMAREGERFGGLVTYPLAVTLLFLLFQPSVAAGAWAILALGDPAAAWVGGRMKGSPRIPWNGRKSVAGSAAFALVGAAGAVAVVLLLGQGPAAVSGDGAERARAAADLTSTALVAWSAAGVVGALAESLPLRIDDNLPVALAAAMTGAVLSF